MSEQGQVEEAGNPGIVLSVLTSVERDSTITQRKLAGELGIALGLANAYLRRCVRKGLVKMRQVPLNRYAYYLTPQGFAEKSRLTAEYLAVSLDFFRRARSIALALLRDCEGRGWRIVALYGAGDLAEIAVLSSQRDPIEVLCVIDPEHAGRRCAGLPVVPDLAAARLAPARRARRHHPDRHAGRRRRALPSSARRPAPIDLPPTGSSRRASCASRAAGGELAKRPLAMIRGTRSTRSPHAETKALENLLRQGYAAYLPRYRT